GLAVNAGGAAPFCVMGDESGKFGYRMEIIVPASSELKTPADLKGKRLTLVAGSHSGFKAPVVILWEQFDLQPGRDYVPDMEGSHDVVAKGVAANRIGAGAVAGDLLKRLIARGDVDGASIRTIFTSSEFPPACYAHAHQLKPELAAKIRSAFLEFPWANS